MPHQKTKKNKNKNNCQIRKRVTEQVEIEKNRSKVCELIECEQHIMKEKHLQCFNIELAYHILILDDVVYNQTMGPGATLDKRRPDLRDELGYIAPPNRKLPPVPGSNYNTCDRIKRGTVISKHLNFQCNIY